MSAFDELWEEVALSVCRICVDNARGGCHLMESDRCALKTYFAEVTAAIDSVHDDKLAPYVIALRERVCSVCKHLMPQGRCAVRDNVDCALDRYYPLVIESIEQARRTPR